MKTRNIRNNSKNRTCKKKGGKTFGSSKLVNIYYDDNNILCDVCKNDKYNEVIGALEKSKVRSGFGQFFFGEAAEILDNTSVIIYVCSNCGNCRIIRNTDKLKIVAKEVE